jgi:hypothetical protein
VRDRIEEQRTHARFRRDRSVAYFRCRADRAAAAGAPDAGYARKA